MFQHIKEHFSVMEASLQGTFSWIGRKVTPYVFRITWSERVSDRSPKCIDREGLEEAVGKLTPLGPLMYTPGQA